MLLEQLRPGSSLDALLAHYDDVRRLTLRLCEPLSVEDMNVQSMPQASPAKWHLAHTTWFFETFLLAPHLSDYRVFDPRFGYLFNSYYNAVGERVARHQRGLLSRPGVSEVLAYRRHVDDAMRRLLESHALVEELTLLGLNHEQQHQELLLTDVKHAFASNPLRPAYLPHPEEPTRYLSAARWVEHPGGLCRIGHEGPGFAYDNETPRHPTFLQPFRLSSRLVSCGNYQQFIEAGGYDDPTLWLSDGWDARCRLGWEAPLYWERQDNRWRHFTLAGLQPVKAAEPVCHVSYYEADAFARWAGARLPTEAEWEVVAVDHSLAGSFLDSGRLHPGVADAAPVTQLFGEAWQWTAIPYVGYPGYRPADGALGEYNGKFMCNQLVLRGGSCLTPRSHFRVSYRNFFPPEARWQLTGIRLAQDSR